MGLLASWRHKTTNETEQNPFSHQLVKQSTGQWSPTSGGPGWRKQVTAPQNGPLRPGEVAHRRLSQIA
jgi:hypothetical protein